MNTHKNAQGAVSPGFVAVSETDENAPESIAETLERMARQDAYREASRKRSKGRIARHESAKWARR